MAETNEPRALSAALAGPAFATRGTGLAMHHADRHIERWAPETGASRVRPMRSLGFVDRLISPWIETAQRSASLRLFEQYTQTGFGERPAGAVSWVFPRPWYQDELDWMAAARRAPRQEAELFTTRGTYVAPGQQAPQVARTDARGAAMAMPAALYEYVAPSMSIAQPAAVAGVGYGGESMHADAYSPLVPLAAVQAAQLMARAVAPAMAPSTATDRMSPALRGVLAAMLERAATSRADEPSRIASVAPELVTPPAPRPPVAREALADEARPTATSSVEMPATASDRLAEHYAAQHARIVELQRITQRTAERELAARAEAAAAASAPASTVAPSAANVERAAELRESARRSEAQLRETAATRTLSDEQRQRAQAERSATIAAEQARLEERVAQRVAERTGAQRLHEQSRTEAAAHARAAAAAAPTTTTASAEVTRAPAATRQSPPEVAAALASLPPELAAFIGQRPERAMQAIEELDVALRTIELIARGAATGTSFEVTRGPRLVMPAGLGGLVAAVERTTAAPGLGGVRVPFEPAAFASEPGLAATSSSAAATAATAVPATARPFAPALAAATRFPTLPWLAAAAPRPIGAATAALNAPARATSALAATAATAPAALGHVAWADRWLARFAGASKPSLDALAAPTRMDALAATAPGGVFVSPTFDIERDATPTRNVEQLVAAAERRPTLIAPPAPVIRYADDAETPDDVFVAISAAATRQRTQPAPSSATRVDASVEAPAAYVDRTPADAIASSAPAAPNAGLSAQLAASPFASALRHVLPMPSAVSFDVRSLFSGGLSTAYLAGLLAADTREVELAAPALPGWAAPGLEGFAGLTGDLAIEREAPVWDATYVAPVEPGAEGIAATEAALAGVDADVALPPAERAAQLAASTARAAQVAAASSAEHATQVAAAASAERVVQASIAVAAAERAAQALAAVAPITTMRASLLSWSADVPGMEGAPARSFAGVPAAGAADLEGGTAAEVVAAFAASAGLPVSAARSMLASMSLPMLGDDDDDDMRGGTWTAPGMIASRAHNWSVAQERSASDLALDFVTPELVLAARVYGLGPSEAAQAARLAISGAGHLTAMAGTVDRAFIQAMAIDADRRERLATLMTAYPLPATAGTAADAIAPRTERGEPSRGEPSRAEPSHGEPSRVEPLRGEPSRAESSRAELPFTVASAVAAGVPGGTAFGVDRRAPRGAFLWPSASVAALGLNAAMPEGEGAMSVAALELLAARAVAEIGTFAALEAPGAAPGELAGAGRAAGGVGAGAAWIAESAELVGAGAAGTLGSSAATFDAATFAVSEDVVASAEGVVGSGSAGEASLGRRYPFVSGARREGGSAAAVTGTPAGAAGAAGEPGERDVLAAATELVPSARRARFEALYLALGQSTAGRSWSPAARAARALALAGHTDEAPASARERAAAAWDVLPIVYASEGLLDAAAGVSSDGAPTTGGTLGAGARGAAAFSGRELPAATDWSYAGAGLGALSARAGEALGSYVAPAPASAPSSSSSSSSSYAASEPSSSRDRGEQGAVLRAPTAMQELVRTGRPAGRYGGGEVEIPPWFESAARKMFESQGQPSDGISIAELTLVTAAPATHIAASRTSGPSAGGSLAPAVGSASEKPGGGDGGIDIETTAQEIYRYILTMMDAARARNGEPYL